MFDAPVKQPVRMHRKLPESIVFKHHLDRVPNFGVQHWTQYPQVFFSRGSGFSLGELGTSVFAVHYLLVLSANSLVAAYSERLSLSKGKTER